MKNLVSIIILCCIASFAFIGVGCQTTPQNVAEQTVTELHNARTLLASERQRYEQILAEAKASGDAKAEENAAKALSGINKLEEGATKADGMLQRSINNEGEIDPAMASREIAPLLPYPFNLLLAFGVPTAVALWKEHQRRTAVNAGTSIVHSIDKLRILHPEVKEAFVASRDDMQAMLTPEARRLVREEAIT